MSQEDTPAEAQEADAPKGTKENPATVSQEPKTFDADYVKSLRSESAANRKKAQEAIARIEELEARDQSELEKAQTKAAKLEQAKVEAEAKLLRYEVAAEKDVPAEALDFLTGNTREELEAKADKLLELVKSRNNTPEPDFDGGAREPAEENLTPEEEHNRLFLQAMGLAPNT